MTAALIVALLFWIGTVVANLIELVHQRKLRKEVTRLIGKQNQATESLLMTEAIIRAKWLKEPEDRK